MQVLNATAMQRLAFLVVLVVASVLNLAFQGDKATPTNTVAHTQHIQQLLSYSIYAYVAHILTT